MATHAGIALATKQPNLVQEWESNSNSLVVLAADDEKALKAILDIAEARGLPVVPFHEPDINDELTAIALFSDEELGRILDTLPLALRDPGDPRWQRELHMRRGMVAA